MYLKFLTLFCLIATSLYAGGPPAPQEDFSKLRRQIEYHGEKKLYVSIDMGTGLIFLEKASPGLIFDGNFLFQKRPPRIVYETIGEEGRLRITCTDRYHRGKDENEYSSEITSLEDLFRNEYQIKLSPKIPLNLQMDMGLIKGEIDLGGLKVRELGLHWGVVKTTVDFKEPNPITMEEFEVEAGVGKLQMYNLGNANFEYLTFDGGLGSYVLYFDGQWRQDARVDIEMGLGKIYLYLPRDVGVRLKVKKSFLSSLSIDEIYKKSDYYYNENWGKTSTSLDIRIETGLGKIIVEWLE